MTDSGTHRETPLIGIRLMRPEEVARTFGCTKSFVYRLAKKGYLSCIRIGRTVRFDPKDVTEFIEGHRKLKDR